MSLPDVGVYPIVQDICLKTKTSLWHYSKSQYESSSEDYEYLHKIS